MAITQSPHEIRRVAKLLDDAVESGDTEAVLSCFADECVVELPGATLRGKAGVKKALGWMYGELGRIAFDPVTILVEGNTFFEEFLLQAKRGVGAEVRVKATEVLVYQDYKVTSLRLYFDRLALAAALAHGFLEKWIVRKIERVALRGLV